MTVQCWEMLDSMSGSVTNEQEEGETREVRRRYLLGQTNGFNDTVAQIEQYAPSYVQSDGAGIYWVRKRLDVNGVGNKYFDCTAIYQTLIPKPPPQTEGGSPTYVPGSIAWDTSGNTEHITQAITEQRYGANAPNFHKAINVSGGSVNGIDVVRPGMRYSETWIMPVSVAMSCGYINSVYELTGTVNNATFRCFPAGSCLFMGARGQWQGDMPYVTVTFDFEARPEKQVDISESLPGIVFQKKGWQYVWFLYKNDVDQESLVQRIAAAYLDTIYEEKSWAPLGIVNLGVAAPRQPLQPMPPLAARQ